MASSAVLGLLPPPPPPSSPPGPNLNNNNNNNQGVRKCGYLRKQKHGHKRFFVLRGPGGGGEEAGGARLEYYESEKKWRNKSGAPKRVIALDSCLNINKRADAKHKYLIALYTKDEYFAVAAENEQEQEGWYRALTDLLNEGKAAGQGSPHHRHLASPFSASCGAAAASLAGDELNYGLVTPAAAAYREVWQVTLKPKGLGQSKNLTGVHRLCLSARTIGFVRLNCELPSVTLQLMNIRRCGHSDSFFFIEVGRSAATGPGELWMQADDSVVAQNIHETILEAMKALKELSEFRPRSKSQSSSSSSSGGAAGSTGGGASATHPITVPGRRHHHHLVNLPPSQTGLLRRSRTDSLAAGAGSKGAPGRVRTASEGDGCRVGSLAGSPVSPGPARTPLSRSHTLGGGGGRQAAKLLPVLGGGGLPSSRSMSMPASHSPPSAASPGSLSSSSGLGSEPAPPHHPQRPSSGSASVSGSPSDAGFMSFDEYGSSPGGGGGEPRPFSSSSTASNRSNTPESVADTPPVRDADLYGYVAMERPPSGRLCYRPCPDGAGDRGHRQRTYSLTTPCRQRSAPPQVSSASLDEYTLMRATFSGSSGRLFPSCHAGASPKVTYTPYPEDYGDVEIGSHRSSGSSSTTNLGPPTGGGGAGGDDDGYMPMTPGVAAALGQGSRGGGDDYMPMSPTSVSAPKQILQPRAGLGGGSPGNGGSYKTSSPGESSPDESGYMRMWCGSKLSVESSDGRLSNGDYINMSPRDPHHGAQAPSLTPPDFFFAPSGHGSGEPPKPGCYSYGSLPRSYKSQGPAKDNDQYVFMNSPGRMIPEEVVVCGAGQSPASTYAPSSHMVPSPLRHSRTESFLSQRCQRVARPSRLSLETLRTMLPSMNEHPLPPEPKSPGEYINIDFGDAAVYSPPSLPADSPASSLGSGTGQRRSPLSDYMNIDFGSQSPSQSGTVSVGSLEALSPGSSSSTSQPDGRYLKAVEVACLSSPSDGGDYTEMTFGMATTPPQPIVQKPESARVTSPTAGVKRLTLSGVEAFILSNPPPDPNRGAKVIRADPQGRRRHSSETFSSTTTVTPVSPSFAHHPKRHNSASVENVSLRKSEGLEEEQGSSPMCRETSAGFQNGLNYIAIDVMDGTLANCDRARSKARHVLNGGINGVEMSAYASIDFLSHNLKEASAVKE
ncbi:insulin receptor substrate 2 isoform X2 [Phaenicophaeus curvirostris]|uniref:insulin receptor substrate 2 isoform X2 n=1 Tax=Phaenicophaeus curvirostris TaxID=33595 RepID=UPI0037F0C64D